MQQIEETIMRNDSKRTREQVATVVESVAAEYREAYSQASVSIAERTALWVETDDELRA